MALLLNNRFQTSFQTSSSGVFGSVNWGGGTWRRPSSREPIMPTKTRKITNTRRPKVKVTAEINNHRPKVSAKITPAVRAWLAENGRKGGIATNNKRAKEAA